MSYGVVLADPPWSYRNKRTGGSMSSGADAKYATMTAEEIEGLGPLIESVSHPGSYCFLWATCSLKDVALRVLAAWGYTYKTTVYWNKIGRLGMGFWFRGQVEELLVGARPKAKPFRCQERNIIEHPTLGHSHKPEAFSELIERAVPSEKRLELFATRHRPGWTCLGYELDSLDIRDSIARLT